MEQPRCPECGSCDLGELKPLTVSVEYGGCTYTATGTPAKSPIGDQPFFRKFKARNWVCQTCNTDFVDEAAIQQEVENQIKALKAAAAN
jgi:hypothetical protein